MFVRIATGCLIVLVLAAPPQARPEVRVQDIVRLQGQRTNRLMGYGLVVGLNGTGDGEKYAPTMRALMSIHERYHSPVLGDADLKGNRTVALVAVEATIPEFGAREGQSLDVRISAIGGAKSLRGGQLLTTPLQYAMFDEQDEATQQILALAGGQLVLPDELAPTTALIRQGATLEQDFFYSFIEDSHVTLVLDDTHAGWTWAYLVARALNHELTNAAQAPGDTQRGVPTEEAEVAVALGPKNILLRIPPYELARPANFISRALQTPLFMLPQQQARVTINRATKNVAFTGTVTVSPTVLQIPGLGTVTIGKPSTAPDAAKSDSAAEAKPNKAGAIEFGELLTSLGTAKVTPDQLINAIEHLYKTGTLHAQLQYE